MDNSYDPFVELDNAAENYARPRRLETLVKGRVYKVTLVSQKQSDYKDPKTGVFPMNTHVQYFDAGLKFTSILPKPFNDKTPLWINSMNGLIGKGMGPKLVYYGKCGMAHEAALLRHTEGKGMASSS